MTLRIVNYIILKVTGFIGIADADFANSKPEAVSSVGRSLCSRSRTMRHQDADKLGQYGAISEPESEVAAGAIRYNALREGSPFVSLMNVQMHWIVPAPILDLKLPGIRRSPLNANGIDLFAGA